MKIGLVVVVAVSIVAGCAGTAQSSSRPSSAMPTARPTAIAQPAATPTAVASPSTTPGPTGSFVATGNMTHARMDATATLLQDGRVLIAGGVDDFSGSIFGPAELFDPSTGSFAPTGSMTAPRFEAAAVRLADGRVLIAGGNGCPNPSKCTFADWPGITALKSAELFDPRTGRFTQTGSMADARDHPTALVRTDGSVLVVSGYSRSVEQYDPRAGKFTRRGSLLHDFQQATAVLLPTGKALIVGEGTSGYGAELFDPVSGQSMDLSLPPAYFSWGNLDSVTMLHDGRVLFQMFDGAVSRLATFTVTTGQFAGVGTIETPYGWEPTNATLMTDGRVLFTGGRSWLDVDDSAGIYDPVTGFHLLGSKMTQRRTHQMTIALPDGTALVAGGIYLSQNAVASAELFKP